MHEATQQWNDTVVGDDGKILRVLGNRSHRSTRASQNLWKTPTWRHSVSYQMDSATFREGLLARSETRCTAYHTHTHTRTHARTHRERERERERTIVVRHNCAGSGQSTWQPVAAAGGNKICILLKNSHKNMTNTNGTTIKI